MVKKVNESIEEKRIPKGDDFNKLLTIYKAINGKHVNSFAKGFSRKLAGAWDHSGADMYGEVGYCHLTLQSACNYHSWELNTILKIKLLGGLKGFIFYGAGVSPETKKALIETYGSELTPWEQILKVTGNKKLADKWGADNQTNAIHLGKYGQNEMRKNGGHLGIRGIVDAYYSHDMQIVLPFVFSEMVPYGYAPKYPDARQTAREFKYFLDDASRKEQERYFDPKPQLQYLGAIDAEQDCVRVGDDAYSSYEDRNGNYNIVKFDEDNYENPRPRRLFPPSIKLDSLPAAPASDGSFCFELLGKLWEANVNGKNGTPIFICPGDPEDKRFAVPWNKLEEACKTIQLMPDVLKFRGLLRFLITPSQSEWAFKMFGYRWNCLTDSATGIKYFYIPNTDSGFMFYTGAEDCPSPFEYFCNNPDDVASYINGAPQDGQEEIAESLLKEGFSPDMSYTAFTHDSSNEIAYVCTHSWSVNSILEKGFSREYASENDKGQRGGSWYGLGVYGNLIIGKPYNSIRGNSDMINYGARATASVPPDRADKIDGRKYGAVILRCVVLDGWKNFLIFDKAVAQHIYGQNWRIEDQIKVLFAGKEKDGEYLLQALRKANADIYGSNSDFRYEVTAGDSRTSKALQGLFKTEVGSNEYEKWENFFRRHRIRGAIYHGGNDGYCFVCYNFSEVVPVAVSYDNGESFTTRPQQYSDMSGTYSMHGVNWDKIRERLIIGGDPVNNIAHLYKEVDRIPKIINVNGTPIGIVNVETKDGKFNCVRTGTWKKIFPIDFDAQPTIGIEGDFIVTINNITIEGHLGFKEDNTEVFLGPNSEIFCNFDTLYKNPKFAKFISELSESKFPKNGVRVRALDLIPGRENQFEFEICGVMVMGYWNGRMITHFNVGGDWYDWDNIEYAVNNPQWVRGGGEDDADNSTAEYQEQDDEPTREALEESFYKLFDKLEIL